MITPEKRNKMEKLVYDTFNALDPTKANTKKYQEMFSSMTDIQFDKFFKELFKDPSLYLILNICDYEIDLKIEDIEKAAKVLNIPLLKKLHFLIIQWIKIKLLLQKKEFLLDIAM